VPLNVCSNVPPIIQFIHIRAPFALAPHGAGVIGMPVDGFGGLVADPLRGAVNILAGVWQEQMHMRRLNGKRADRQTTFGFLDHFTEGICHDLDHFGGQHHGRVFHAFSGHALANGITGMEFAGVGVSDLLIPSGGPMATFVTGEPLAVTRFHKVVPQRVWHIQIVKPRAVPAC